MPDTNVSGKGKIILPLAALAAFFGSGCISSERQLFLRGLERPVDTFYVPAPQEGPQETASNISNPTRQDSDGYLRAQGQSTPTQDSVSLDAAASINPGRSRLSIYAGTRWDKFHNPGDDLEVVSNRLMLGLGHYLVANKKLEIYIAGQIGIEEADLQKAIDMDADRIIVGGQAGV